MNKSLTAGLLVLAVLIAGGLYFFNKAEIVIADTTIPGDYAPGKLALANNATLTVQGDLTIDRSISCKDGNVRLNVEGDLTVNGKLSCDEEEDGSIAIVVKGDLMIAESATVASSGHVQIVKDEADLLTTDEEIEAAYEEAGSTSGDGPRFGPFVEDGVVSSLSESGVTAIIPKGDAHALVKTAYAEEARDKDGNVIPDVVIGGDWIIGEGGLPPGGVLVETPGKKVKRIILNFDFGPDGNVALTNFHLVGPAGRDGASDEGKSCNARGEKGEDAMRFRVHAASVTIDDFTIELGNGGAGGYAETTKDCDHGIAKGGDGGEAGNMKMTADNGITIRAMRIVPGSGGAGGGATAYGKDGANACPGEKGGDATATGGKGGKNKKELSAEGAVSGVENVSIAEVIGGFGGGAYAYPGKGGSGTGCNCNGGMGGKASATGGQGGDASVKTQGVGNAGANGGDGGDAEAVAGAGGAGGHCPLKPSGGKGGNGGNATAKEGKGGAGTTADGEDGTVSREKGGDGGNGGNGCGPGGGGAGGKGREPGVDGTPGKLECPLDEKKEDPKTDPGDTGSDEPANEETGGSGGSSGSGTAGSVGGGVQTEPAQKPIQVIQYQGKYLPVDQLIVESEEGCDGGQPHWHAAHGVVIATDGSEVFDPGPQCGYGKVSQTPVMPYPPR